MITSWDIIYTPEHEAAMSRINQFTRSITGNIAADQFLTTRSQIVDAVVVRAEQIMTDVATERGHRHRTLADEIAAVDAAATQVVIRLLNERRNQMATAA